MVRLCEDELYHPMIPRGVVRVMCVVKVVSAGFA